MWDLKSKKLTEAESRIRLQGQRGREMGDVGQRVQSFSYAGWISSGDLMYSKVTIINNTALYT